MTNLETALKLHDEGYNLLPVGEDKRPLVASWKQYQDIPASREQIELWWREHPLANFAAICGKHSGFLVVDIDPGADISGLVLPPTKIVRTGRGGFHYYYKWVPEMATIPNAVGLKPHVDIRGEGSYILIPPSRNTNGAYELIVDAPLATLPLEQLNITKKSPGEWQKRLKGAVAGQRNASAAQLLGGLTRAIPPLYWEDTLWPFIEWWNQNRCQPSLSKEELYGTFNSICKRSLEQNWSSWLKED